MLRLQYLVFLIMIIHFFLSEQLPYVGKRIKQNLQNIDFDEDSEDDDDWSKKAKKDFADEIPSLNKIKPRERLPRRQVAPTNLTEKVQEMSEDDSDDL